MQLFFNPNIDSATSTFFFDKEESGHIIKVMRRNSGDILMVTNGLGQLFTTEIILAAASKCTIKVISIITVPPMAYNLHLAVAPTKMNDRYEWFLEKATEIGVTEITPIICDRSERKIVKNDRFDKIILAAMKQSANCYLPKINEPIAFKDFIKKDFQGQKFIAHCEDSKKNSLKNELKLKINTLILIGPEGDFTENEVKASIENKFTPISLGSSRLRTETAAVVACHTISLMHE